MGAIYIGTSGYSFKDWKGTFYPEDIKGNEMLKFYAQHFNIVEINSTYYAIPRPQLFEKMIEAVPEDFVFTIKASKGITHERNNNESVFEQFENAIRPLAAAKKLKGILAQFPWSFRNTKENRLYLSRCKDFLAEYPLIVEFRNSSWITEPVFELLKDLDISYCVVDEPELPGLVPSKVMNTNELGYVRFHGRSAKTWWEGDSSERYNYLYSEQELKDWVPKIKQLADVTKETYIFFNNCHAGYAARNAKMMKDMLDSDLFGFDDKNK
ncbi:MAG: DUF72 domain-containing protein [bacterium]